MSHPWMLVPGFFFASSLMSPPNAHAIEVAQQLPAVVAPSASPATAAPQPEYVMPATPVLVVATYPRVRWGAGGGGGFGVRPLDFGVLAHGSVGVQFNSLFGVDLETIGLFGVFQFGGQVGLLADFTLAPVVALALGPSLHGAVGFFSSGWAVAGTARLSLRPWARTRADGARTGFTVNLWLDLGRGDSIVGECNPTCPREIGLSVAGFLGLGYSRF